MIVNHPVRIWCSLLLFTLGSVYGAIASTSPGAQDAATVIVACLAIILILIDLRARRKPAKPR